MVRGRVVRAREADLADLGGARVRDRTPVGADAGLRLREVHLDQAEPVLLLAEQLTQRLQHRHVGRIQGQRLAQARDRLAVAAEPLVVHLGQRVQQRQSVAELGRGVDQLAQGCGERLVIAGVSVKPRELLEDERLTRRGGHRGPERGQRLLPVAQAIGLQAAGPIQSEGALA